MSVRQYMEIHKLRRRPATTKRAKRTSVSEHVRYNEFRPAEHPYLRELRAGHPLEKSPDIMREELSEEHMYYFICDDDSVGRRNPLTPKYVGVLRVFHATLRQYVYVYPLDADLRQMYSERKDASRAWDVLLDGTPYWIDVYAQRKCKK
jgi:hypothetical protein